MKTLEQQDLNNLIACMEDKILAHPCLAAAYENTDSDEDSLSMDIAKMFRDLKEYVNAMQNES